MGVLLRLLPASEVVTLAGDVFEVSELTIHQIRNLEAWAKRVWEDPLEQVRPKLAGLDEDDRLAELYGVYDAVEAGPPCLGDPRFSDLLLSWEGVARLIHEAIVPHRRGWTYADAEALVLRGLEASIAEFTEGYLALSRVAWGAGGIEELTRLIEGPPASPSPCRFRWGKWFVEACEVSPMTPRQFGELTMSQLTLIRNGGEEPDGYAPVGDGEDFQAIFRRKRERYQRAMARLAERRAAESVAKGEDDSERHDHRKGAADAWHGEIHDRP